LQKTQYFIQNIAKNTKTTRVTRTFAKVSHFGKVNCSDSQFLLEYAL